MSAILRRFSRSARPKRLLPCSIVSGAIHGDNRSRLSRTRLGTVSQVRAALRSARRAAVGVAPVMEEPVDGRAGAADVGAEGAEPEQLGRERR